eukprot:TRINITY_DN9518_c0_g1_i1.p1 TRINITY_DN9518_c0_g1~~TRINITY_DN9518_c0_g1_i1.p1  ORF type:complete len:116 (-),score=7.72 TRINITY_DN9518_c0_g1_i1:143-490(-)
MCTRLLASSIENLIPRSIKATRCGGVQILINARPGAKTNMITDVSDESVCVHIKVAAKDGEANNELVSYLSEVFKVKKTQINLERGTKSRTKFIAIESISPEQVFESLKLYLKTK